MKQETAPNEAKTAYSLIRFSTPQQSLGDSRRRQIEKCRTECQRRGWDFDETLTIDVEGVSAFSGEQRLKGELSEFIKASEQGRLAKNPCLILENLDRFSREEIDLADTALWGLVKRGVDVLILSNGIVLTRGDENDLAKRYIVLAEFYRAHGESKRKSDLVNSAFSKKYANASEGKPVQLGYWQPAWVDFIGQAKQIGTFKLNKTADLVHGIARDYLAGRSMLAIANRLNGAHTPCIGRKKKKGKRWTQGQVRYLLTTETLLGHMEIKDKRFPNYYPAVIDQTEWDLLQAKLRENKERKGGSREGEWIANLFRNRCRCASCGGSVSTHFSATGSVHYYYKCQDARYDATKCKVRRMLPVSLIEEDFFILFLQKNPSELLIQQDPKHAENIGAIRKRISNLDQQIADTTELIGSVPVKELKTKLAKLQTERQNEMNFLEEETRKQVLASDAPSAVADIRAILSRLKNAKSEDASGEATWEFDKSARVVIEQLQSPETRKKLLSLIPSLIQNLVIDLEKGCYAVRKHTGQLSKWRDVIGSATLAE